MRLRIDDGKGRSTPTISAAQGKDMIIVVLAGCSAPALGELLADTDVLVAVPHKRAARVAGKVVSNAPFLPHSTPGGRHPEHGKSRAEH